MSKEITQTFGLHHQVITPAEFIKNEQQHNRVSVGLHIFVMTNLASVLRLVYSSPSISKNPLSVLWCPQTDHPSESDLMECAKNGIAFVPSFKENRALAMSIIEGRLKATAVFKSEERHVEPIVLLETKLNDRKSDVLLRRLNDYLIEHYQDEHLCIDKMGQDLGMSRTNFFNKVKSLTGNSPSRFVTSFRLNKAKEFLLREGSNVSDVAFKVGFASTSYFTKCFKEFFNTTPTAFRREEMFTDSMGYLDENELNQNMKRQIQVKRNIRTNFQSTLEHMYIKKEHN